MENVKIDKKFKRTSISVTVIFLLVFTSFILLTPFGSQSQIAKALDYFGMHEAAMSLDLFTGRGKDGIIGNIYKVTRDDKHCNSLWSIINENPNEKISNTSFTQEIKVTNTSTSENININHYFNTNLETLETENQLDLQITGESKKKLLNSVKVLEPKDSNEFKFSGKIITSPERIYLEIQDINQNAKVNYLGWYYLNTNIKESTINEWINTSTHVRSNLGTETSNIISNNIGEGAFSSICNELQDFTVKDVGDYEFGDNKTKIQSRLLTMNISEDYLNKSIHNYPVYISSILNDATFREFVKSTANTSNFVTDLNSLFDEEKTTNADKRIDGILNSLSNKTSSLPTFDNLKVKKVNQFNIYINSADASILGAQVNLDIVDTNTQIIYKIDYQLYNIYKNNSQKIQPPSGKSETVETLIKDIENLNK